MHVVAKFWQIEMYYMDIVYYMVLLKNRLSCYLCLLNLLCFGPDMTHSKMISGRR